MKEVMLREPVSGYRLIIGYLGMISMLVGGIILMPLFIIFFYPEEISQGRYFIFPGVISILIGYLLTLIIRGKKRGKLYKNQDAIIVLGAWIIGVVACAMPFWLTGEYNLTQAIFESTSGWSTTGLSVVDVDTAPKIFLMYRSIILFFGGVGLVLVMTSVLSDVYGMRLYYAEGHSDKLAPNLLRSARVIIAIYAGYIIGGAILYYLCGMAPFDALNHSIGAVSTGGFSTKSQSIGYYNSLSIEVVTLILMILGCTNFLVHLLLIKGKFKSFFTHCEMKFMLLIIGIFTPIVSVGLIGSVYQSAPEALREALFQVTSALTTTGFQTVSQFNTWSPLLILLMTLLMLIGGGAGSTAGGIKQYRIYIMFKEIWWDITARCSHSRVVRAHKVTKFGTRDVISDKMKQEVNMYVMIYMIIFIIGTTIFTAFNYPIGDAMFEFASALGTVGLSVGITGYDAHPVILWTAIVGMFVGRLEIYIIFLAILRGIKDIKNKVVTHA